MAAVLGLDDQAVQMACDADEGMVSIANYCPGQYVISGRSEAVQR